jgi:hypothetical protein
MLAPVSSRGTFSNLLRRSPRLTHPPDQKRQADEGYQQAHEMYAQEPSEGCAPHAGKRVPQRVQDHCRCKRSPTLKLKIA